MRLIVTEMRDDVSHTLSNNINSCSEDEEDNDKCKINPLVFSSVFVFPSFDDLIVKIFSNFCPIIENDYLLPSSKSTNFLFSQDLKRRLQEFC